LTPVDVDGDVSADSRAERLFLGLWPPPPLQAQIASIVEQLTLEGGRWIAPANLHMTLAFLGDCDPARRACVEQAAASAAAAAFDLRLVAIQWRRRTGIVWLAALEVPEPLIQLIGSLNSALVPCGHVPGSRPFRAHVTLARHIRRLRGETAIAAIDWRVQDFCLVSSVLTSRGSDYTVLRRWPLRLNR